ncbi:MAG: PaaI family thioesterase [Chloroflexota bacterium]
MTETAERVERLATSPNNWCFACGPGNPHGLHLHMRDEDGVVRAEFVPEAWHEGWEDVIHGGILTTLLDEAMAYVLHFRGVKGLTARMEVRFRAPARKGEPLLVEAQPVRDTSRVMDIESRITAGGSVVAEATARFMKVGTLEAVDT